MCALPPWFIQFFIQPKLSKMGWYRMRSMKSLLVSSVWKIGTRSSAKMLLALSTQFYNETAGDTIAKSMLLEKNGRFFLSGRWEAD